MSSTYRRICLSHQPPLVLDEDYSPAGDRVPPIQPDEHINCKLGIGRWSGGLIEVWLPLPMYTAEHGPVPGRWFDVSYGNYLKTVFDLLTRQS